MNPIPPIAHLLAVAVGVIGGFAVMGKIAPDLPNPDTKPAVGAPAAPGAVKGGDANSLFREGPLNGALSQLDKQLAAGEEVVRLRIVPGTVRVSTSSAGPSIDVDGIDAGAPERISAGIDSQNGGVHGLDDVASFELIAGSHAPRWRVQLVTGAGPPGAYIATADGSRIRAG